MKLTTVLMLRKMAVTGLCAIALATFAISARADLITDGSFSNNGGGGQIGFNTTVAGWTVPSGSTSSYFFLFPAGTADGPGVTGEYTNVQLWGPGNGSPNGLPASSPDGGAFVASDPAFQNGALSQTVGGLAVGSQSINSVSIGQARNRWALTGAPRRAGRSPSGSQTQSTSTVTTPNHGFSPWQLQSFTFTANSTSQVLSFLATGGPSSSLPPFSLLDGVSLNQVTITPEPTSWGMLLGGLGLLGGMRFTRAKNWFKR